jgi:hypothetical protein
MIATYAMVYGIVMACTLSNRGYVNLTMRLTGALLAALSTPTVAVFWELIP